MKMNKLALLVFGFGVLMTTSPSWAGEVGDQSAEGAASIGTGALFAISTPLIVTAGAATGDSEMIGKGLMMGASAPLAVASGVGELVSGAANAADSAAHGIVHIVHTSGEKLVELNENAFDNVLSDTHGVPQPPKAQAKINNQQKTIPLVVRKQYVEMNEKVAK